MTPDDDMGPELEGEDLLAAEYVLGVLPAEERAVVARRIDTDVAFARRVDAWEARFSPLGTTYPEVDPPASVKTSLDRLLPGAAPRHERAAIWQSLAFWRGLTVAALAALLIVLAMPYIAPQTDMPAPRLVASLAGDDTDVHYYVVYDGMTHSIGLSHVSGDRAEGRDFELWVIEGNDAPESLGVIPVGANVRIAVSPELERKIAAGSVFAISLEPQGGSPTGAPTGPVVAAGGLATI